ncbi:hypothetical protein CYMTET_13907 [Cymbomonas tetramitiformis]|uniref:Uncharacterized protein n=1 Tax=Cymbomonas tetramitiformis TaxID=36881 RepID=A0AAE0LAQ9_9CHLO|nr:hypothetical protein CYMTET_13907 [Cymbomonas tetramitiformis]
MWPALMTWIRAASQELRCTFGAMGCISRTAIQLHHDADDTGTDDIGKNNTGEASPEWEYDTPVDYDSEDDASEIDDLVADDPDEHAEAREKKRQGLQLIMDEKD